MPISNLSADASPFPKFADPLVHILLNFNNLLDMQSFAMRENIYSVLSPNFLTAHARLREQFLMITTSGNIYSSVESSIPPTIPLNTDMVNSSVSSSIKSTNATTLSNKKRQRSQNWKIKKSLNSLYPVDIIDGQEYSRLSSPPLLPPKSSFSKYLQAVNDGRIKLRNNTIRVGRHKKYFPSHVTVPHIQSCTSPSRSFILPVIQLPASTHPLCIIRSSKFSPLQLLSDSDSDSSDSDLDSETDLQSNFDSNAYRLQWKERWDMNAEDVLLPSKQIEWELGSHAMKYCEQQLWCYNCGKPAHGANCDLYCSDCLDHPKHFHYCCPEFHNWLLQTQPTTQTWYKERSQNIRKAFTGDPRLHRPVITSSNS